MKDGSVRVRIRLAPGFPITDAYGPMLQLDIRHGSVKEATDTSGQFQFQVFVPNRDCKLLYQQWLGKGPKSSPHYLWEGTARKLNETDNVEVDWEFRAVGDEFSAWADGKLMHSAHLDKVASGYCTLALLPGMQITRLETTGLIPTKPGPAEDRVNTDPPIDWLKTVSWPSPWALEGGQLKASVKDVTRYLGTGRDASVRLRFIDEPAAAVSKTSPPLQVTFYADATGSSPQATYQLQILPSTRQTHLLRINKDAETQSDVPTFIWKDVALAPAVPGKGEMELELRAQGGEISVWSGTERLATTRDDRGKAGGWVFIGSPGVIITSLETSGITRGSDSTSVLKSAGDLPAVAGWQDVTETVREKARKTPELIVDENGIRHAGAGPSVRLLFTPPGLHDQAVLVRYTGRAQVDLHLNPAGFLYAIAQWDRMIFQSQASGNAPPVKLVPDKFHPPDFDAEQPHELLVTLEGTRLRAWLDGRFVTEAKADTFTEGATGLMLGPQTIVHRVEVAELDGASAKGAWQPIFMKPEDFGGDLRDVDFRDGATFLKSRSHLAPATSSDGGIRATLRFFGSDRTGSLTIRSTEPAQYGEEDFGLTAFIAPKGTSVVVKMRDRPAGVDALGRHDFALSPALKEGELFTFELKTAGKKITVTINGREVGSLDDTWTGGPRRIGITPSNTALTEFRDVAVMRTK